jgi:alpha-D-xyloside xylohydrolase
MHLRHPITVLSLIALVCLMAACPSTPVEDDAPDLMVAAGDSADGHMSPTVRKLTTQENLELRVDGSDKLVLQRGQQPLLTLHANTFGIALVEAIDEDLNYDPSYLEPDQFGDFLYEEPSGLRWIYASQLIQTTVIDGVLRSVLDYGDEGQAEITVTVDGEGRFALNWKPLSLSAAPVMFRLSPRCDPTEGFYGLGEYFDQVEHRGKVRTMHFVPAELESGHNEAHVPIPLLLGTRGWGLFIESLRPMTFALATESNDQFRATVGTREASDKGLDFFLFAAEHPLDLTKHYYELTGYPGAIARTALGPWIWRDEVSGQERVEQDMHTIREYDLATTGYWIDRPYATDVNSFDFKEDTYPSPEGMMKLASALGFEMALWHTPYLDPDGDISGALSLEAHDSGYFPPVMSPLQAKWGPPIDFSNPEAFTWWQERLSAYQALGIKGYKLDYAQEVVIGGFGSRFPWSFHDGSNELTMHRNYQRLYHEVYRGVLPQDGGFLLVRSGTYGDQVNGTIIWPGDIDATMAKHGEVVEREDGTTYISVGGLPAAVVASSSLGPSGFPFFASDTGGYRNAPPSKETYIRWFQHTAFTPVMQAGTNTNDLPWEFGKESILDDEILELYRTFARIHLRLFPYIWTYAARLAEDGRAIQRPLGLAFPELAIHPSDIYMLGDALLVAPVITAGATTRQVDLPSGFWVEFFSGERFEGATQITAEAPLDTIPVYLRAGAPVPMLRPSIDSILSGSPEQDIDSFDEQAGPLWVLLTTGPEAHFKLYDGTVLTQTPSADGLVVTRTEGNVFTGAFIVEVIGLKVPPSSVILDGAELANDTTEPEVPGEDTWIWNETRGGTILIHCSAPTSTLEIDL